MKALIICDSFKGSISSKEANECILHSTKKLGIKGSCISFSDGGEGFLEAINDAIACKKLYLELPNAKGSENNLGYYLINNDCAYFEMAEFAGLAKLKPQDQNPLYTSTYSFGLALKHAIIEQKIKNFVIGIGGSATNDAGIGMLSALGYKFLDKDKNTLKPIGLNLINIAYIDFTDVLTELKDIKITLACDVINPLYGKNGAAYVYARQKGANDKEIKLLDDGLINFSQVCKKYFTNDFSTTQGSGAAGGLGFGFLQFLNANFKSGFSYLKELLNIEELIKENDLIISAEGSFDEQSLMGKVLGELYKLSTKYDKKFLVFCGINKSDYQFAFALKDEFPHYQTSQLMQKEIAKQCLKELSFNKLKEKIAKK